MIEVIDLPLRELVRILEEAVWNGKEEYSDKEMEVMYALAWRAPELGRVLDRLAELEQKQ